MKIPTIVCFQHVNYLKFWNEEMNKNETFQVINVQDQ